MAEHLAQIYGTEKDKVNCPFYYKIGACRHGDRCSRQHNKPLVSQTLLLSNLYVSIEQLTERANALGVPPPPADISPDDHFDAFFEDVYDEMTNYGHVEAMVVCENRSDHLAGNTYVKYADEESARNALSALHGRYYAGRPVLAEFSPVLELHDGRCRKFETDRNSCDRGDYCHFMHTRRLPEHLYRRLFPKRPRGGAESPPSHGRPGSEREELYNGAGYMSSGSRYLDHRSHQGSDAGREESARSRGGLSPDHQDRTPISHRAVPSPDHYAGGLSRYRDDSRRDSHDRRSDRYSRDDFDRYSDRDRGRDRIRERGYKRDFDRDYRDNANDDDDRDRYSSRERRHLDTDRDQHGSTRDRYRRRSGVAEDREIHKPYYSRRRDDEADFEPERSADRTKGSDRDRDRKYERSRNRDWERVSDPDGGEDWNSDRDRDRDRAQSRSMRGHRDDKRSSRHGNSSNRYDDAWSRTSPRHKRSSPDQRIVDDDAPGSPEAGGRRPMNTVERSG